HEDARRAYRAALETVPGNTAAHLGLGLSYLSAGQAALALSHLQDARQAGARDPSLFNGLGIALDLSGDHDGAQKMYRDGLARHPGARGLQNNLALSLLVTGDWPEAARILQNATAMPGAGTRTRQNFALALGLLGEEDEAARIAALDLPPDSVAANLAYYGLLRESGDLQAIGRAVGLVPDTGGKADAAPAESIAALPPDPARPSASAPPRLMVPVPTAKPAPPGPMAPDPATDTPGAERAADAARARPDTGPEAGPEVGPDPAEESTMSEAPDTSDAPEAPNGSDSEPENREDNKSRELLAI
ncbi:MAG: tetratricopeptide repeat protein, partial [Alphaproteobacteria bacterium]